MGEYSAITSDTTRSITIDLSFAPLNCCQACGSNTVILENLEKSHFRYIMPALQGWYNWNIGARPDPSSHPKGV